jgi:hypothetical protein
MISAVGLLSLLPTLASAQDIRVRRDRVVAIRMDTEVRLNNARRNDRFFATVSDDRDFPRGTVFEGRVLSVNQGRRNEPGFIDMEFFQVNLPDGSRARIDAVPVRLDRRYLRQDRDGRWTADRSRWDNGTVVAAGGVGGLILGGLLKRPFEGALIGVLAGIVINETGGLRDGTALRRGDKIGALVRNDFFARYDGRRNPWGDNRDNWDNRDNRDGRDNGNLDSWDRNGRGHGNGDGWDNRNDPRNDPWDDRGNRDNGFDRNLSVEYRNRALRWDRSTEPYRDGNVVMVPLDQAARQFGVEVDRSGKAIYLDADDRSVRLEINSNNARVDGRRVTAGRGPVERDGVLYVPLEVFGWLRGEDVSLNGQRLSRISN